MPWASPVVADRLGDGKNVGFGERPAERRAAMPAGSKADELLRIVEIGPTLEIFALEPGRIDQHLLWRRLAGDRVPSASSAETSSCRRWTCSSS